MEDLIAQIRAAARADLFYVALIGSLALPDICGALDSEDGRANGGKYRDWLRSNVPGHAAEADLIWGLRCSLLHKGSALPDGGHSRVAFTTPGPLQIHRSTTDIRGDSVYWISIPMFVEEVTAGAESWFARVGGSASVQKNMRRFAHWRPEGLPPHVVGAPVVA
jgi:hypothetical protein